jgi:hypothetical protein
VTITLVRPRHFGEYPIRLSLSPLYAFSAVRAAASAAPADGPHPATPGRRRPGPGRPAVAVTGHPRRDMALSVTFTTQA